MALLCQSSPMLSDTTHSGVLLGTLCDQRAKGLFCDVTIVVEDIKFRAHRNVLAASSGYFRNALSTPEVWTSGQVLELLDLRSEVFARILNFIYSSKVALTSVEDVRALVAAGKRLGIPFLERLTVSENSTQQTITQNQISPPNRTLQAPEPCIAKRKASNSSRGPRITNAFSITEIATSNDPFSPLDLGGDGQQSAEPKSVLTSCQAPDSAPSPSGTLHTLTDHSYAVSLEEGVKKSAQPSLLKSPNMKAQPQTLSHPHALSTLGAQASQMCSPLKKRNKRWGSLNENTPGSPATPAQMPSSAHSVTALTASTPTSSSPDTNTQITPVPMTAQTPPAVSNPSPAPTPAKPSEPAKHGQPHPHVSGSSAHRCRRRFPGLLFCRFCHRKFMHLKRLRNHEQVCSMGLDPHGEEVESDPAFISTRAPLPPGLSSLSDPLTAELPKMVWEAGEGERTGAGPSVRVLRGSRRAYPCSVCKRAYVSLSSLRRHENVHSWQRAYPCHYCNKVFALAEYRTKHEIWHTGERRYQCIFCLETFMTYYILKNHQKSYHGIDPRLSVNRKSANGGFKGSVYPIKLYRLLPMKFRKRRYRTYGQTFLEAAESGNQTFPNPPNCTFPSTASGEDGLPAFSEPVTFMATPKTVAPIQPSRAEAEACLHGGRTSPPLRDGPHTSYKQGMAANSHGYTLPALQMQTGGASTSVMIHDSDAHNSPGSDGHLPLLLDMSTNRRLGPGNGPEDLSTAVRPLAVGSHVAASATTAGKTVTYIAKPACPGSSSDSRVPALCQITVKIGSEAIVRRSFDGSNLIPRKRRRHSTTWSEEGSRSDIEERSIKSPSQHLREDRTSLAVTELCDDVSFCDDADEPWRPYYSYKSKRKAKKLRSRDQRGGRSSRPRRPKHRESCPVRGFSLEQNFPSNTADIRIGVQRTTYTCEDCQSTFNSVSMLRRHMTNCRPRGQVHYCHSCGKQCPPQEVAQDGKDFTCSACVEDSPRLENSTGSRSTDRRYRCSFCPQRFLYLATRRSHERKHLEKNGKGYGCYYRPNVSLAVDQKKHFIKTEEEEVEVEAKVKGEVESKASVREEVKPEAWEGSKLDAPVTPKLEDQTETSSGDRNQRSVRGPDEVTLRSPPGAT